MAIKLVLIALAWVAISNAQNGQSADDLFVIFAPKIIRPGLPVRVSASVKGTYQQATVVLKLVDSRSTIQGTASSSVSGARNGEAITSLNLQPPSTLSAGRYTLKAELQLNKGTHLSSITDEVSVTVATKTTSVFIQMDKAVYKPSQTVQFRTIVTKPDLTPYQGTVDIDVFDADSNKIKQWKSLSLSKGVVSGSLPLADQPVLGTWKIKVTTDKGQGEEKEFDVDEYVLPKFEVTAELPSFMLIGAPSVKATVTAKYTFGKGVDGTADVLVRNGNQYARGPYNPTTRTYDPLPVYEQNDLPLVDGKVDITLSQRQYENLFNGRIYVGNELLVEVNVTETLTGIVRPADEEKTKFYTRSEKIEFLSSTPTNFKPGFDYTGFVKLTEQDGGIVANPRPAIIKTTIRERSQVVRTTTLNPFWWGNWNSQPSTTSRNLPEVVINFPQNGVQKFDVQIPGTAVDSVTFQIVYDSGSTGAPQASKTATETKSPTNKFIQVTLSSENLKAGDTARFDLATSDSNRDIFYMVVARGSVVLSGSVYATSSFHQFEITATNEMAPSSKLVAYYVNPSNKEIIVDSITFNVEGIFKNQVSLQYSKDDAGPGQNVDLQVTASSDSFIGLLAVDQSVLLLGTGNDVTSDDVVQELEQYNSGSDSTARQSDDSFFCCFWWPRPISGDDASEIISNSGLVVLTNALVYKKPAEDLWYPEFNAPLFEFDGIAGVMKDASMNIGGIRPIAQVDALLDASSGTKPTGDSGQVKVRKVFPETWIWSFTNTPNGTLTTSHVVPDTITSWVATAFAVHDSHGLGISSSSAKLRVFKPFFVSLNLPYSVVRGEEVVLQAVIFNYLGADTVVQVELPASDQYNSITVDENGQSSYISQTQLVNIQVRANTGATVSFPIIPKVLGPMSVRVVARAPAAADAVQRDLLVEAEGVEKSYTRNVLIDRTGSNSPNGGSANGFEESVEVVIPPEAIVDTKRVEFSLIGNVLGPALNGLDKLIKMPYGCGEQNMLNFAPTVFVTEYLSLAGLLTNEQKTKSVGFMEKGYQRELTYQRSDGSFSAFGNSDSSGSMWLTAFVVKSFKKADRFIFVDSELVTKASTWMIRQQNTDGSFPEPGRVIHKSMMGGGADDSKKKYTLTAYVLTALAELVSGGGSPSNEASIRQSMSTALRYLENYVTASGSYQNDKYLLGLLAYAFEISGSSKADLTLSKLNELDKMEGGLKYWELNTNEPARRDTVWHAPYHQSNAIEIELAAYALLTYSSRNGSSSIDGLPILRWITTQRNKNGGFSSTQDTVVGLQALSAFALFVGGDNLNMTVTTTANHPSPAGTTNVFSINKVNELVLQMNTLPRESTTVDLFATGIGMALATFTVSYNEEDHEQEAAFNTSAQVVHEDPNKITVRVCTKWLLADTTGMAVMEIGMLSGFSGDVEGLEAQRINGIKRIETANRKIVIYWEELTPTETCINLDAQRTALVAKSQPAAVRVYDYYEPEKQQTIFYTGRLLKDINICEVCGDGCKGCDVYFEKKRR